MKKTLKRPSRWNPNYPGIIIPAIMCKSQKEIIEMVEQGKFEGPKNFLNQGQAKAGQSNRLKSTRKQKEKQ